MIKKAKKSVAIGLSVALAVTSVNIPVDSASAAAKKAKLSATKKTLTAGKSTTLTLKTNKKKAKTIKTIKAKYVKVSTSKKSVATVKKVSKKSKVTGIKVTAKKAGKATITVKVTKGTYKGTYKCKVTVKKKASATKKPTQKPTEAPATEAPATEEPATTPAITEAPTAEPSTSPAITATPTAVPSTSPAITATPAAISYNVIKASNITKDGSIFKVNLSFDSTAKADDLKDTVLTLTGAKTVKAKFAALDAEGKAVYEITDAADIKALTPFDTTSNGTYKVTSDAKVLVLNGITAEYEEALVGNAVYGYVVDNNGYKPVANAVVKIDGGQSVTTDANGFYKIASVNGQKKMEVSAPDYLDNNNNGERVYVNRNHVTSQNFVMTKFDQKKVYANITVKDKETKNEISEATVYLYKGNSDTPVVKLNGTNIVSKTNYGQVCYANEDAVTSGLTNSTEVKAAANTTYLEKGATYTVKVEKKLSAANLDDVYMLQTVGTFTVGNKYDNSQEFYANKVKKTPSMTLTQALADADVLDQVGIEGTSASEKAMNVKYDVYTNIYGGDGDTLTKLTSTSTTAVKSANIKDNKVDVEITGDVFSKKGKVTLPTGDYFVVVDPQEATGKDNDSVRVAIAAVKIHVTEGEAAKGNVTITKGFLREFVTNVALTPEQEKPQNLLSPAAAGTKLFAIEKDTTGYKATATEIKVGYDIKQIVDGVKVPVVAAVTDVAVKTNEKNAFVATNEYNRLLSTGEYAITSKGDYVEPVEKTESINNKSNMTLTYNTNGAWNMSKAVIKVGKNNKFVDAKIPADFNLTKVVAKNVATGKETVIYTDTNGIAANCGATEVAATSPISDTNEVAEGKYLVYDLSGVDKKNLPEGKYTFTYSFKAYKNAVSEYSAIGLENVKASAENTFVKSTNDKTTVTGVISTKSDAGVVAKLNGETGNGSSKYKALVMLLNNKNQIAGLSKVSATGEYTITDGVEANVVAGGAYKLVIRAFGYETKVVDVTVDANKELTENVTLEQGGKGEIKAYVSDTNKNVISDIADSYAFDKYAIVQPTMTFVADLKKVTQTIDLSTDAYDIGVYKGSPNGKILTFSNLSAGDYTVSCGSTTDSKITNAAIAGNGYKFKTTYSFKNELVTIKNNGDKMYPEWQYAKAGDTSGSDLVKLSILFSDAAKTAVGTDKVFAITVTDKEGNLVTVKDGSNETKTVIRNGLTVGASSMDILVPSASTASTVTYTVTLYTKSGNQVATALVPVQRVDTSVAMTVNDATVD